MTQSCVMIMADGARRDVFEGLLREGRLPNIQRHIIDRGSYQRASSVFASTTGPAHLPFLTGLYPGTADIPGIRWFDRRKVRFNNPLWGMRSYCGIEAGLINSDLSDQAETIYQAVADSADVFGTLTGGVLNRPYARLKTPLWLYGHLAGDYRPADHYAAKAIAAAGSQYRFSFVMFPGIDGHSHHYSPFDGRTVASYLKLDRAVGSLASNLIARQRYQTTMILLVSDHGHTPVQSHFDIGPILDSLGYRAAYHSGKAYRHRPDLVSCVSGNGMAHLYLSGPHSWSQPPSFAASKALAERLLDFAAIDLVGCRFDNRLLLISRRGQALIYQDQDQLAYQRQSKSDPLGLSLPQLMSPEQALRLTFDSRYPDGPMQLAQLLRSARSGDLIVSAAPGYDLRKRYEGQEHRSGHGALHRDHMLVPVASSVPLTSGPIRTVDIHRSVLDWLGVETGQASDGVSRLSQPYRQNQA